MRIFETDVFPFTICIGEIGEAEKIKGTFVDEDGDELQLSDNASGMVIRALFRNPKRACSLIVVNKRYANIGTAGHEANHAADDLLENIGIPRCPQTSEVYSYVIGFITQKIYETIWE